MKPIHKKNLNKVFSGITGLKTICLVGLLFISCSHFPQIANIFDFSNPVILEVIPMDRAVNVLTNIHPYVVFSEPMDKQSLINGISLIQNQSAVPITFDGTDSEITIIPVKPLQIGIKYTLTFNEGLKDLQGNAFISEEAYSFTTGVEHTNFSVKSRYPAEYYFGTANMRPVISVVFSAKINTELNLQKYFSILPDTPGMVTSDGVSLKFTPFTALVPSSEYTVTISSGLYGENNARLENDFSFSFFTGFAGSAPVLLGITSADRLLLPSQNRYLTNYSHELPMMTNLFFDFSMPMYKDGLSEKITLTPRPAGYFQWVNDTRLAFIPSAPLTWNTWYSIRLGPDIAGTNLIITGTENYFYYFTGSVFDAPFTITYASNDTVYQFSESVITTIPVSGNVIIFKIGLETTQALNMPSLYSSCALSFLSGNNKTLTGIIHDISALSGVITISSASIGVTNNYRLRILGGASGLKTLDGRTLNRDYEYIIRAE